MRFQRGSVLGLGLALLVIGCCGAGSGGAHSGSSATSAVIAVSGRTAERGTRGSILVFAYGDLGPSDDPSVREALAVGSMAADGSFDLAVPPGGALTLVFLADGSNDGAIDEGDPIAVLSSPELSELEAGDRVQIADLRIDFKAHRASANVEVARVGGDIVRTPTPAP